VKRALLVAAIVPLLATAGSTAAGEASGTRLIAYTVLLRVPGERSRAAYIYGLCVRDLRGRSRRLTADRLRADESAAWRPDGNELAFERMDERRGTSAIMVMDAQRRLRNLSGDSASDSQPTWAPDGRRIAFVQAPGDLYVMNADGTDRRLLVPRTTVEASAPRWSPDGRHIAFVRGVRNGSTPAEIVIVNSDGTGERKIAEGTNPAWAPDAAALAYDTSNDLPSSVFVIAIDGGPARRLTSGATPVWSPDGRQILFSRERLRANGETADDFYVMAADGTRVRQVVDSPLYEFGPAWQSGAGSRVFPLGDGPPCAVAGSERGEPLSGSEYRDYIYGFGGRDALRARGGDDVVSGNEGADVLQGGDGNDRIGGGFDNDRILGGHGDDAVFAGGGRDDLRGGPGSDRLFGGAGRDSIAGGPGDDLLGAVDGSRDRVSCGPGMDTAKLDRFDRAAADCEEIEPP
jgi:hypothetical protein